MVIMRGRKLRYSNPKYQKELHESATFRSTRSQKPRHFCSDSALGIGGGDKGGGGGGVYPYASPCATAILSMARIRLGVIGTAPRGPGGTAVTDEARVGDLEDTR